MAISMLGDGCEHCQPENTISILRDSITELEEQLATVTAERDIAMRERNDAIRASMEDMGRLADSQGKAEQLSAELDKLRSESEPVGYRFGVWDGRKRVEVLAIDYLPQLHPVFGMEEIRSKEPLYLHPQAEGKVLVDAELDKATFIGEFKFGIELTCSACNFEGADDECEVCGGEVSYQQPVTIPWTTLKEIHKAMITASKER